ncbi:MAG: tetratricopeptide repeat protein [Pseudomonadota bacterium]
MSETDSFIQEVTEEVRQDQMLRYWKKYGPFVIGGVGLLVAGAAGWNWMMAQEQAQAEARGASLLAVDPADTEQSLALTAEIEGPANLIAEMSAAATLAESGNYTEAAARYAQIAGRSGILPAYRDLAILQQVRLAAMADASAPTGALDALIEGSSPYRLLALELRGALRIMAGDRDGGHADLNAVIADPEATGTLRQRAGALLTATGGEQAQTSG